MKTKHLAIGLALTTGLSGLAVYIKNSQNLREQSNQESHLIHTINSECDTLETKIIMTPTNAGERRSAIKTKKEDNNLASRFPACPYSITRLGTLSNLNPNGLERLLQDNVFLFSWFDELLPLFYGCTLEEVQDNPLEESPITFPDSSRLDIYYGSTHLEKGSFRGYFIQYAHPNGLSGSFNIAVTHKDGRVSKLGEITLLSEQPGKQCFIQIDENGIDISINGVSSYHSNLGFTSLTWQNFFDLVNNRIGNLNLFLQD